MTWQVEVPITASIWPGAIAFAAGAVTWASTLPTATAIPSGSAVHPPPRAVSEPARPPSCDSGCSSFSATKPAKPGLSAVEVLGRGVALVLVDPLVARRADVARLLARTAAR